MRAVGILGLVALAIFTNQPDLIQSANPCNPRQFNHDSIVCVCDENYCDSFDPISKTAEGVVQVYESSRAGKRLEKREVNFGNELEEPGSIWNVAIDKNTKYQEIIGFGGSWSDAAAIGIGRMSEKLRNDILRSYFSDEGIEYSTARVVISGSDFSNRPYTYDDTPWDWDLEQWSLVEEDTLYKIPQMQTAQSIATVPIKFYASSWSPPAWLKTNNELNHGGQLQEGPGSIFWQTYAKYLLKFFDAYKANGINWWGMTIQNEPMTGWDSNFPWNTCGFNAEMERDFVKTDLGPILEQAGYTPDNFAILALDHNRPLAEDWANVVFSDPEASKYIKGLGVHWYFYGTAGPYNVYDNILQKFPDKFLLATEACNRDEDNQYNRPGLGKWVLAEDYAHDILLDLLHFVGGWTDWNLVLDQYGGPNWVNNNHSAPIIVNPEAGEFYKNVQYYAMAHYSKFLPPGTVRIGSTRVEEEGNLELGAFLRPDGGTVIIVINTRDDDQFFNLEDGERGIAKIKVDAHSFNSYLYY